MPFHPFDPELKKSMGAGHLPCCGVTVVAVTAGIPFEQAFELIKRNKGVSSHWRGVTYTTDIEIAWNQLGVRFTDLWVSRAHKKSLRIFVRDVCEVGKTYAIRAGNHFLTVKKMKSGRTVRVDQSGTWFVEKKKKDRRFVTHAYLIEE